MRVWGRKVGAAFTRLPPLPMKSVRRRTSNWAESSFFPPCRATSTVKVRPWRWRTLSSTALPTST